ncbi:hypothetical protein Ciccas_011003 [Cichlidogyrus casuarinus]|uniref:XK-related protein n=1 Tax=Cichlidogyrus casuarinus TaxID=1844966 RepID=A0ABD2PU64_9PLAT
MVKYVIKSEDENLPIKERYFYARMKQNEESNLDYLYLVESLVESGPQLTIQVYLLFTHPPPEHLFSGYHQIVQIVSMTISLICLIKNLTAYKIKLHKMSLWTAILFTLFKFCFLAFRVISFALVATVSDYLNPGLLIRWIVNFCIVGKAWNIRHVSFSILQDTLLTQNSMSEVMSQLVPKPNLSYTEMVWQ